MTNRELHSININQSNQRREEKRFNPALNSLLIRIFYSDVKKPL